ncbi:MAG: hypothetical protein U5N86_06735 [Planctomycetota bacterium]|nr:hypothetical protein [Planctomycetota bacterium]
MHSVLVDTGMGDTNTRTANFLRELSRHGGGQFVKLNEEVKLMRSIFRLVFGKSNDTEVKKAIDEYRKEARKRGSLEN